MMKILKKTILYCLLLAISSALFAAPAHAEEATIQGGTTGSEPSSAADAAVMLRALAFGRLNEEARPDLDFTKNGDINGVDARAVLFYACGGIADWVSFGERVSSGLCDERLFDRFSYLGTRNDENGNYKSENISVSIQTGRADDSDYFLADIYIQDISSFVTAFSNEAYLGKPTTTHAIFETVPGAIIGMNGDYYSINRNGPVIRNGVNYQDRVTRDWDIAVLDASGVLTVYPYGKLKKDELALMNVYQTWVFGPSLLDEEGHAKTNFRSWVQPKNPRSVLCYYEPGHYGFLAVDGRSKSSKGITMAALSQLCEELGFASAYNLDGGQSSVLMAEAGAVNNPYRSGRPISDILVIREVPAE